MWEAPPADITGNAVSDGQEVLTPAAIEAALADFRSWLKQLSNTASASPQPEEQTEAIDLHTLLAQFLALRHDVNLQTKATRSQQEVTGQTLQQLSQALEALRQTQAAAQQANRQSQEEALRPFLKTILDVHDAFSLAESQVGRARETILPLLDQLTFDSPPAPDAAPEWEADPVIEPAIQFEPSTERKTGFEAASRPAPQPKSSLWQRLFGRRRTAGDADLPHAEPEMLAKSRSQQQRLFAQLKQQQQIIAAQREQQQRLSERQQERMRQDLIAQQKRQEKVKQTSERLHELLDSVITGYTMSLQRVERALQQSGLEPIPCIGEPFDPEQMEVVAAVVDSGRPAGEVIEEVRRGYRWRDRMFRYAQVSVAKS